jgi:peptide deformylase
VIHPIRLYGDPVLRRTAAPVDRFDDDLTRLADDMIETMHDAHGVGLAAPQIGLSKRLFIALELPESEVEEDAHHEDSGDPDSAPDDAVSSGIVHVMVNPEITERRGERVAPDGCLSVPGLWVEDMRRDAEVVVRYQDVHGQRHERRAEGHFAHVVQHELDHLDGVLYFDRLEPDERQRFLEAHRAELADLQRRAKALLKELRAAGTPVR